MAGQDIPGQSLPLLEMPAAGMERRQRLLTSAERLIGSSIDAPSRIEMCLDGGQAHVTCSRRLLNSQCATQGEGSHG
jgi:hypothetical protein